MEQAGRTPCLRQLRGLVSRPLQWPQVGHVDWHLKPAALKLRPPTGCPVTQRGCRSPDTARPSVQRDGANVPGTNNFPPVSRFTNIPYTAYTMPISTRRKAQEEAEAMNVDDQETGSNEGKNERGAATADAAVPTSTPSSSDDVVDAKITLAHLVFEYQRILDAGDHHHHGGAPASERAGSESAASVKQQVMELITAGSMAPFYLYVCKTLGWEVDAGLRARMETEMANEVASLDEAIKKAEEEEGDVEVKDMLVKKAVYLANVGDVEAARAAFGVAEAKTAGSGPRMDLCFEQLRMYFSVNDWRSYKVQLDAAWDLCNKGGDWERKNKLKVYEALHLCATRQFRASAELFLNAITTFTATEVLSYDDIVFYTVVLAVVSLDRPALMEQVVDNPDILATIDTTVGLRELLSSLTNCEYGAFFKALAEMSGRIQGDMLLYPHFRYYLKQARIVVYSQYLQSYKSVSLESMAGVFGVGVDFLDEELSGLISEGFVAAKIDRVDGVVHTTRPDPKNAAYQQVVKMGDHVLNKLQKLSKLADVEV